MLSSLLGESRAFGIVEIGDQIDQLGLRTPEQIFDLIHPHSVIVAFNGNKRSFVGAERLQRREITWIFDDHAVATLKEDFSDQIYALLRSVCDQDLVWSCADAAMLHP